MNSKIQKDFEDIFAFTSEEEKIDFEAEKIHLDIMHKVSQLMDKFNMNKTDLAKKLKVSNGYITQLFTANKILNLKTIAKIQQIFSIKFSFIIKSDLFDLEKMGYTKEITDNVDKKWQKLLKNSGHKVSLETIKKESQSTA